MGTISIISILAFLQLYVYVGKVNSLECYVCENQEDNTEKCVKTIMTCEYNQDVCLTEIKWGSTPYWSQGAKKQYYVSKRCSNKTECAMTRQHYMPLCTHIWYQDWVCSDCCQGDRCNYYIISGESTKKPLLSIFFGIMVFNFIYGEEGKEMIISDHCWLFTSSNPFFSIFIFKHCFLI